MSAFIVVSNVLTFFYCLFTNCEQFSDLSYDTSSLGRETLGVPAWADDGTDAVVGIMELSQEAIIFPPLQGFVGRGNFRYKLQIQENLADSSSTPMNLFDDDLEFDDEFALSLFFMKSRDYLAINILQQPQGYRAVRVLGLTDGGQVWGEYSDEDLDLADGRFFSIPSRNGQYIAALAWLDDFDRVDNGIWPASVRVMFLEVTPGSVDPVFSSTLQLTLNVSSQELYFAWDETSTKLVITDFATGSVEIVNDESYEIFTVTSNCTDLFPPTSSGIYRISDNTTVILDGNRYSVDSTMTNVTTPPYFLC